MEILRYIFEVTPQVFGVGFFALLHSVWTNNLDVDNSGNVIQNPVARVANRRGGENISFPSQAEQSTAVVFHCRQHHCCNPAEHWWGACTEIIALLPKG